MYFQCDQTGCPKCHRDFIGWWGERPQKKQDLMEYSPMSMVGIWFIFYAPIYIYVDHDRMICTVKNGEYVSLSDRETTAYCQGCQTSIRIHPCVYAGNGTWRRL